MIDRASLAAYCYNDVCGNTDQCAYHEAYNAGVDAVLALVGPEVGKTIWDCAYPAGPCILCAALARTAPQP